MDNTILHDACIVSFYMSNIDTKIVEAQKAIVAKFNKRNYPHYQVLTNTSHGHSMDLFWGLNGLVVKGAEGAWSNVTQQIRHQIVFFLDIDCVPLNDFAIDAYVEGAARGELIGNIQRSNHIQNNQHTFAAPSAVAINRDVFDKIGRPSAVPNYRGDVGEEYTWMAEAAGVKVELKLPLCYDRPPTEGPFWALKDGQPVYGQGTTFGEYIDAGPTGLEPLPLFYHNFQIFHPGSKERFLAKCEKILRN